jgi:vacuolar-type H+-ATPase subunit I/STV1
MKSSQEAVMSNTIRTVRPHLTLNSDGRPHPLLNAASIFTLILGLASFAIGLLLRTGPSGLSTWAIVAAATGLAALLMGLVCQMMSATREERVIIVTGIIAGFVGLALGLAHGGFAG